MNDQLKLTNECGWVILKLIPSKAKKDDKFNIATTIDRRPRRVATSIYEGKNPEKFAAAIANNICNLNIIPLSITADNGIKNHQLKTLKKQFPTIENFYSTHSYASWEKRTIEQKINSSESLEEKAKDGCFGAKWLWLN